MRLRHQALIILLAAACLGLGGCARLLQSILAPQEAAMATAGNVANTATAPARGEIAGLGREVDRLLGGKAANQAELERIKQELERRLQERGSDASAQNDPERLRPWHPRAAVDKRLPGQRPPGDELRMGRPEADRGLAAAGRLPDGIAAGELQTPLDLTRIRLGPPR